jgi:hypothetical protein
MEVPRIQCQTVSFELLMRSAGSNSDGKSKPDLKQRQVTMTDEIKSRVNLEQMRLEYEKFRSSVASRPAGKKISFRAVARILEDVHLEGRVRGHRVECDEPPERGGKGRGPAPLDYFLVGAAF